uniref:Uncharacterized protein n=1 Tax=Musa acuminata subsp. malaccensis TaxID=214687 RepID=A0A804KPY1_MUSAM
MHACDGCNFHIKRCKRCIRDIWIILPPTEMFKGVNSLIVSMNFLPSPFCLFGLSKG